MSNGSRTFGILLLVFAIVGVVAFFLNSSFSEHESPAPMANVAPVTQPATTPQAQQPTAQAASGMYKSDFTTPPGAEWSSTEVSETPAEPHRKFLGPFREDPIVFSVGGLPPHQFVHVTFELLTHQPWNGDSGNFGRDLWDMRVLDGQPLIHTTFSNCGFFEDNNEQSFPDQYPWYPTHPGWTGAASKQSLGFTTTWGRSSTFGTDSTYHFDITFPHTASALALQFKSQTKKHQNHPYGFLNFKMETVEHPVSASETQMTSWWNDLAGEDASKAYNAVWSLIATGDSATRYIQQHLPAIEPISLNIDQHARFEYGGFQYTTPNARQFARMIHVLEVLNSPESKKLLSDIGYTGTPQGGPPTRWDAPQRRTLATPVAPPPLGKMVRVEKDSITIIPTVPMANVGGPLTYKADDSTRIYTARLGKDTTTPDGKRVRSYTVDPASRDDVNLGRIVRITAVGDRADTIMLIPDEPATKLVSSGLHLQLTTDN